MNWFDKNDNTPPVISAKSHISSSHGNKETPKVPPTCLIFEMGMAMAHLETAFAARTLMERLPCFLENPKYLDIADMEGVCFTRGGYGAPAAVDTLETLLALGAKQIIIAGMCGVFSEHAVVGDVVIPHKIYSEEGTSQHYVENHACSIPDQALYESAVHFFDGKFPLHTNATISSDAIYRQTYYKEALWRQNGCIGVDMEASALLCVSRYYGVPAVCLLLASDKHPLSENSPDWEWGGKAFGDARMRFVDTCVAFARHCAQNNPQVSD